MKVRGAVKLKHGTIYPGEKVLVNCRAYVYIASYYDEEKSKWMYVVKDPDDIWGGLMEIGDIRQLVHHGQQEAQLKGQYNLFEEEAQ